MPLILEELSSAGNAAINAGIAFALSGVISTISSLSSGVFSKRISIKNILIFSCIGTGLFNILPMFAASPEQMIIAVGISGLLVGGIITSSNALVGLSVPIAQQGIVFGLSQSAMALGKGIGPILGGGFAPLIGLRPVFLVAAGIFIIIGFLSIKTLSAKANPNMVKNPD
jgi:DHA1 family multidrug resistance protein-like MFS transporter